MLDERKLKVLYAIIDSHLHSAEPIGSRTISKDYNLGVSAATIRNEMSDLEDKGYLIKPHSSAGRLPSDKAYRLYVDEILKGESNNEDIKSNKKVRKCLYQGNEEITQIIRNSASILSSLTSYTAIAMSPKIDQLKLKHIQLININEDNILLVIVNSAGVVKNSLFHSKLKFTDKELNIISNFLNSKFTGLTIDEIKDLISSAQFKDLDPVFKILKNILPYIEKSLRDLTDIDVYMDGVSKILNFPEYNDLEKARDFISFIENKEAVLNLFTNLDKEKDLNVIIGEENIYDIMQDCTFISTKYSLDGKEIGQIGIIGPTRMDYIKLIDILNNLSNDLSEVISMLLKQI